MKRGICGGLPWIAVCLCALAMPTWASAARDRLPPTLYHDGVVFTGRSAAPDATWFLVQDGTIADIGDGGAPADRWPNAVRIDLAGRFVAPGFVDSHIHFVDGGLSIIQVDLAELTTPAALAGALDAAKESPIGGWVLARNLDVSALGGTLPTHDDLGTMLGDEPAYIALKGGHHVYVNPAGMTQLGIDARTPDPRGGTIVRDATGAPQGVLIDAAAWDALRAVYDRFGPDTITQAMLAAQDRSLSYGITTIGDNTFFPDHLALYDRLRRLGLWHTRIAARSFGPAPETDFLMKPMGRDAKGAPGPWLQYFGQKYFADESLSPPALLAEGTAYEPGGTTAYTEAELRTRLLFAGPSGTAFHCQGRRSVERLVAARRSVEHRRRSKMPDVIDHCGSCGGDLPEAIREAGFRVTVLPGQLHELPQLVEAYGEARAADILPTEQLLAAGVEPALTSDWPYGSSVVYPGSGLDFHRLGLSPLALVAVATSGRTPGGDPIPYADARTIPLGEALLGVTAYGAKAVGREDVGTLAPGSRADFVILETSPFEVDPAALYHSDVSATFIDGMQVYPATAQVSAKPRRQNAPVFGWTPSPIIGYSPTQEFILGGALFFYPFKARGVFASLQVMGMTRHPGLHAEVGLRGNRVADRLSLQGSLLFDNWRDNDFGIGMDAEVDDLLTTEPLRVEADADVVLHAADGIEVQLGGRYAWFQEGQQDAILARSGAAQPLVRGHHAAVRAALVHDGRDALFSPRRGASHEVYLEVWPVQASKPSPRVRVGMDLRRFVPLRAPNLILALRLSGGASLGTPAYHTNYSLGGIDQLRGYYSFRFRGHHFAASAVELRFPIWSFLSGVLFAEAGRVWVASLPTDRVAATSGGIGLRIGLPPDFVKKLRFDVGFSPDQWGIFFSFDEAF